MKVLKHNSKFVKECKFHRFIHTQKDWLYVLRKSYGRGKSAPHGLAFTTNPQLAFAESKDKNKDIIPGIIKAAEDSLNSLEALLKIVKCDNDFLPLYKEAYKNDRYFYEPIFHKSYSIANKYVKDLKKLITSFKRGLHYEEVGLAVIFSGNQKPNKNNLVSFVETHQSDVCNLCKVYIPFEQHLRFKGVRHVQINICPYCLAEIAQTNQKQIEDFNKKNPEYYNEYAAEIVVRSL